ncbi:peptidase [Lentisalinibacter salinarum]|uniref:peptidase n=1 Tax=Lentisalinibacter salinarum TaxID=2992239 RepID=UPI00386AC262
MTYCLAANLDEGMVFVSDSRTNAGVDQISTFSKMHTFCGDGERFFVLLSAGNLATTQAVVAKLARDVRHGENTSLASLATMAEVADYVGAASRSIQARHAGKDEDSGFIAEASFILGGQIRNQPQRLYLVYPEGNYVHTTDRTPYLQIGETKYGKPILDRIVARTTDLETAARCALVSMDSTMRSNATVGPPVEVLLYRRDSQAEGERLLFEEDSEYLAQIRSAWQESLRRAFEELPPFTRATKNIRLVDG